MAPSTLHLVVTGICFFAPPTCIIHDRYLSSTLFNNTIAGGYCWNIEMLDSRRLLAFFRTSSWSLYRRYFAITLRDPRFFFPASLYTLEADLGYPLLWHLHSSCKK